MKRHLVEGVVPVMVELRRMLTEEKHPLLADLMRCFASLLKEYKGEIEEILVADKLVGRTKEMAGRFRVGLKRYIWFCYMCCIWLWVGTCVLPETWEADLLFKLEQGCTYPCKGR
jgi:hypothetical protein